MYATLNDFIFIIINNNGLRYVANNYDSIRDEYYAQKESNDKDVNKYV